MMKINEKLKQYLINDFQAIFNKRMLILFGALFAIYAISDMGAVFFLIPLSFALIPFRRDDYQNITLKQKNIYMVRARYLFTLALLLVVLIISIFTSNVASMFSASNIDLISIYSIILMIIIFLTISGILLPIFYKLGFRKGQYLLYLVVILFAIINLYQARIPFIAAIQDFNKSSPYLATLIGIGFSGIIYIVSYIISIKIIQTNK
ncbi:MAG: ABC-2 transporter permease [Firmicutes bacterium]|nr:ABC-2 transporter permease [Bacillota bacterium]